MAMNANVAAVDFNILLYELKVDVQFFRIARYNILQFIWCDIVHLYALNSGQTGVHV